MDNLANVSADFGQAAHAHWKLKLPPSFENLCRQDIRIKQTSLPTSRVDLPSIAANAKRERENAAGKEPIKKRAAYSSMLKATSRKSHNMPGIVESSPGTVQNFQH